MRRLIGAIFRGSLIGASLIGCSQKPKNLTKKFRLISAHCEPDNRDWYSLKIENQTLRFLHTPPLPLVETLNVERLSGPLEGPEILLESKVGPIKVFFGPALCGGKSSEALSPQPSYRCEVISVKRRYQGCGAFKLEAL